MSFGDWLVIIVALVFAAIGNWWCISKMIYNHHLVKLYKEDDDAE